MYKERIAKIQNRLVDNKIDALAVLKPIADMTNPVNIRYLCGFSGSTASMLITQDAAFIFTDFRYQDQVQRETEGVEIIIVAECVAGLSDFAKTIDISRLAVERFKISYNDFRLLEDSLTSTDIIPVENWVEALRLYKDSSELTLHQQAIDIAEKAFLETLKTVKPGLRELDVALELEYQMRKLGGDRPSFATIVASGIRSALPHGIASDKILDPDDVVTVDWGTVYKGYCSDTTRAFAFKKPNGKMATLVNEVIKAQKLGVDSVSTKLSAADIDAKVRNYLANKGFVEEFGHPLGHGVGLDIHEQPRLRNTNNQMLEASMIITIEPGLYISGFGGVRIEDMVVVEKNGCRVFNKLPHDLFIVG